MKTPADKNLMQDIAANSHGDVPVDPSQMSDDTLLDLVQRRTFEFFWDCAHASTGLALDRVNSINPNPNNNMTATGGSGFGVMALIVAVERGWLAREAAVARLLTMTDFLSTAEHHHGIFPHYIDGATGKAIFWGMDDAGADVVETAFLFQGLLCARAYFAGENDAETRLSARINELWQRAEWSWHTPPGKNVLIWHWSPEHEWGKTHEIHGWDECLIAYVLAAASPTHPISPDAYHEGWAVNTTFRNGKSYFGVDLPLGPEYGGPLFFSHFSFLGLDPRGLRDRYADYWQQVRAHTLINYEHCVANPNGYKGYGPDCWGLTASDGNEGYSAHQPIWDRGVIAPTAALASMPYTPEQSMRALRYFLGLGERVWRRYGFIDAFNETEGWYDDDYLAIDQGAIVAMIENHRSGLLWRLFMSCPEVGVGLARLGFDGWQGV